MLEAFRIIAERRITEAIENGEISCGSLKGKPLDSGPEYPVPEDLRIAYKILKNADFLPPELEIKKDIARLEDLIAASEDEHTRVRQLKKLNVLVLKLNSMRARPIELEEQERYFPRIVERLGVCTGKK